MSCAFDPGLGEVEAGQNFLVRPCVQKKEKKCRVRSIVFKSEGCRFYRCSLYCQLFLIEIQFPKHSVSAQLSLSESFCLCLQYLLNVFKLAAIILSLLCRLLLRSLGTSVWGGWNGTHTKGRLDQRKAGVYFQWMTIKSFQRFYT